MQAVLGESRFEKLYEEGQALTLEQAVALALAREDESGLK
jgi:hypothetical protein